MNFTELELLQILILLNRKPGFYDAFAKNIYNKKIKIMKKLLT